MSINFGQKVLSVIDRALSGKPSPIGTLAKEEQAVRTCFEAVHGAGSADALYAGELSKQLSSLADQVADWTARGQRIPPVPAANLARLKAEGLGVESKIRTLHSAMARPTAPAPSPVAIPTAAILAPVALTPPPAPAAPAAADPYPLCSAYENIEDPIDKILFFRANKVALASEDRRQCRDLDAIKPNKVPRTCTGSLISQLESISDPASRVRWYREHKSEVDAEYSRLSQKQ